MANMHYSNCLLIIIYMTNQTIITNSVPPEFLQVSFKSMQKKTWILSSHKMSRYVRGNFFLNRPINFIEFFFSLSVKADFPERRIYASSQLLQKKCLRRFHFPFLQDAERQEGNLFCFQGNLQPLDEYNSFQADEFFKASSERRASSFFGRSTVNMTYHLSLSLYTITYGARKIKFQGRLHHTQCNVYLLEKWSILLPLLKFKKLFWTILSFNIPGGAVNTSSKLKNMTERDLNQLKP